MSTTTDYVTRLKHAQETVSSVSEARVRDAKALLALVPTPRNGLLNPATPSHRIAASHGVSSTSTPSTSRTWPARCASTWAAWPTS